MPNTVIGSNKVGVNLSPQVYHFSQTYRHREFGPHLLQESRSLVAQPR